MNNHDGMLPDRLLFPRSRVSKLDKFFEEKGSFLEKMLSFKCND